MQRSDVCARTKRTCCVFRGFYFLFLSVRQTIIALVPNCFIVYGMPSGVHRCGFILAVTVPHDVVAATSGKSVSDENPPRIKKQNVFAGRRGAAVARKAVNSSGARQRPVLATCVSDPTASSQLSSSGACARSAQREGLVGEWQSR